MPRSLDPNCKLWMALACDIGKTPLPRIGARPLTGAQEIQLAKLMHDIGGMTPPEAMQATIEAAAICIREWENMIDPDSGETIPFNKENIPKVLCMEERCEVIAWLMNGAKPSPEDKKKSESLPLSDAVNSANHASVDAVTS